MTLKKFVLVLVVIVACSSCAWGAAYNINSDSDFRTYMLNDTYTSDTSSVFNLNTDIQLAGYSNWPGVETFRGRFNGNGHTIFVNIKPLPPTGASYVPIANDRAIFINVAAGAVIENLHVEGSVHGYNAGGIASILDGGTIRNCSFSGDIAAETRTGDSLIDNLLDELGDDRLGSVNDIERYDSLNGYSAHHGRINAGGLVAVMEDGTITNCSFRGNVTAGSSATYATAGGIAGRMFDGGVTDCSVVGDSVIKASTATTADNSLAEAGGIVGYAVTPLDSKIEGCTFEGQVDSTYYAGGIAGLARGTIISGDEVLADSEIAGTYSAGGIVGYLGSGGQAVNNTVKAGAIVYADNYSAGGIVGYLDTGSQAVRGNTSDAAIRGSAGYLGGIVGAVSNSTNANTAVGTGNEYSGAAAGIGRDEYNRSTDGNTTPKQNVTYVITTSTLDEAFVGVRYEAILDTNAAQTLSAAWTYSGVLPGGLDFGTNGRIAGTPTEAGTFVFSARANIQGIGYTASKDFTLKITSTFEITPKIEGELSAVQGVYFEQKFSASGGALLSVKGSLPSGVTASPSTPASTITLSGYPANAGTYTFKVEGTSGNITADTGDITLVVAPALELATTALTPATATVNVSYSASLDVYLNVPKDGLSGNSIAWSISGGALPGGLSISGGLSGGRISGTPTTTGTFEFTVRAELTLTAGTSTLKIPAEGAFTLTVSDGSGTTSGDISYGMSITTDSDLASAKVGTYYSITLETDRPQASTVRWELLSGKLPLGLTLNPQNGSISGTPTTVEIATFTIQATAGNFVAVKQFTLAVAPAVEITDDAVLPNGTVGVAYSHTFTTDSTYAVNWTLERGTLPSGLSFSNGTLSGTPTEAGTYTFTLAIESGGMTSSKQFTLTIIDPAGTTSDDTAYGMSITTESLPDGKEGVVYKYTLEADTSAYNNEVTWSVISGTLPPGLSFDVYGTLSGTPTRAGEYIFTILAVQTRENRYGDKYEVSGRRRYTMTIEPAFAITTDAELESAKVGTYYTITLATDRSQHLTVRWELLSGDLPAGLELNPQNGSISGTPTQVEIAVFTIQATTGSFIAVKQFTLAVGPAITITDETPLPNGKVGVQYAHTFATDSAYSVNWTLESGTLPPGLAFKDGTLSGNPTTEGEYTFTLTIQSGGMTSSKEFTLTIAPALSITTESILPRAKVRTEYSFMLESDAPAGSTVLWSVYQSQLPQGMYIDEDTGRIFGSPTTEGVYEFQIQAVMGNVTAVKTFTLTVRQRLSIMTDSPLPHAEIYELYRVLLSADAEEGQTVTWSFAGGNIPQGLTLNKTSGLLSGYPDTEGMYTFTVSAFCNGLTATKEFTLTVGPVNTISNAVIPVLNAGEPFTLALASGNTSGTWSVTDGRLPPGLTLGETTGTISGTPVRAGTYTFTVQNVSGYSIAEKELTIIVDFVITTGINLPSGTTGESYSYKFTAQGVSASAVLWSASRDVFPAGIRLGTDGLLSGTTNESGTYNFTVSAFVSNDVSAQKMVTLEMFTRSALPILNVSLASGQVGEDYFDEMRSSVDGVAWTLAEGELPPGITLRTDGVIMGVPTEAGTYYPVIRGSVSSRAGQEARSGTKRFEITIAPKPEPQQNTSTGGGGGGCSSGFGVLGLLVLARALRKR